MRHAWVMVLAIACGTNARTPPAERAKDATSTALSAAPPDAATAETSADAMPVPPTPDEDEILAALHRLGSEHGDRDVRNVEWWRANAAKVRPHLRAMLEDDRQDNVADDWAVRILGDIGDPADVPLLASVLTTWKYETVRWTAAAALGVHPSPEASAALIAATNHADVDTAAYAADGLGLRKNDPAARARLEELINHARSTMRFHAVNALGDMGGSKAALEKRRKVERDAEVRQAIVKALKKKP